MSTGDVIQMSCPNCGQALQLPVAHAGKKGRCRACQTVFQIPAAAPVPSKPTPAGKVSAAAPVRPRSAAPPVQPAASNELVPLDMNDPFAVNGMKPSAFGNLNDSLSATPATPANPFNPAFEAGDDFRLAPPEQPTFSSPPPNPYHTPSTYSYTPSRSSSSGVAWGKVGSGAGMMLLAVVWFVGGLAAGYIFFYPPILLIIGLVTAVSGLMGSSE